VTLVIVPIIYAIFVLDLKLIKWGPAHEEHAPDAPTDPGPAPTDPGPEPGLTPVPAE
jgi:hypothetical protein